MIIFQSFFFFFLLVLIRIPYDSFFFYVLEPKVPILAVQSALPPSKLVEEVVLLAIEEALLDILEEQSPTLIIVGVLGELAAEVEVVEA